MRICGRLGLFVVVAVFGCEASSDSWEKEGAKAVSQRESSEQVEQVEQAEQAQQVPGHRRMLALLEQVLSLMEENIDPSWFHVAPIRPVAVHVEVVSDPIEQREVTPLARLTGRLIAGNLPKGWGGEYHRLTFFLRLVQATVGVEFHSRLWQRFAEEGDDFGHRLVNSIRKHWGRHVLSAHNLFENRQQRAVAERLGRFGDDLAGDEERATAGRLLRAMVDVYHLSITLPDATFVPLSAWTWTSYSYHGGLGAPTPLSSIVERDWSTMDFSKPDRRIHFANIRIFAIS